MSLCRKYHRTGPVNYHRLGRRFFERTRLDLAAITRELRRRFRERQEALYGPGCPNCGERGGEFVEIEDRDDAVGYRAVETGWSLCYKS